VDAAREEVSSREVALGETLNAREALGYSESRVEEARMRRERAEQSLRTAEVGVAEARGRLTGAEEALGQFDERAVANQQRRARWEALRVQARLHGALDRAYQDLRNELIARLRPELADVASQFLSDLTTSRYTELEIDDQYQVAIIEDGMPKPVISGGEEDISNLVLRLAISQLVAERAGQPLSLLVLDEIFGSLDELRRHNVVELLRALADRFPQVILITHIESVRDGLDRVIRVVYDQQSGASRVTDETDVYEPHDVAV
jgi:exonuclease SbcC